MIDISGGIVWWSQCHPQVFELVNLLQTNVNFLWFNTGSRYQNTIAFVFEMLISIPYVLLVACTLLRSVWKSLADRRSDEGNVISKMKILNSQIYEGLRHDVF